VIYILTLNANNATSNDTQTAALMQMRNTFKEANHTHCFNHMLQLSVKTLLKPFNAGMSLMKLASEEDNDDFDDMPMLPDHDAEGDGKKVGKEAWYDYSKGLEGDDEPEDANSDEINELDQLDKQEHKKILIDTAVIQQTITKVHSDPF
jgi:hypothetical protein